MVATAARPKIEFGKSAARLFLSEYLILGLTALLFLTVAPFAPGLASLGNLLNIAGYMLPLFVAATGITVVMITGGIDLSITSIIALTSVFGARVITEGGTSGALLIGVGLMLVTGAAVGAANGAMITLFRLPPFIITLASMMFVSGFAIWFTQSANIYGLPPAFLAVGKQLPLAAAVAGLVGLSAQLALSRTVFGRWTYAVGQNATAAEISGVPVRAVTCGAYIFAGVCAAVASVLLMGRLETGSPILGREILLDVIGATVVGGTSIFGGKGKIMWTLFGVMFLAVLDNALNLLNMSQFSITIAKGTVILLAAVLDAARQRLSRGGT